MYEKNTLKVNHLVDYSFVPSAQQTSVLNSRSLDCITVILNGRIWKKWNLKIRLVHFTDFSSSWKYQGYKKEKSYKKEFNTLWHSKLNKAATKIGKSERIPTKTGWINDEAKVIYTKYSKHCPYTVAHTIECVCSNINHGLNHGLFISLLKLIFCLIHWIAYV